MNAHAQFFKSEAVNRLNSNIPSAAPVMARVDIDKVLKIVRTSTDEFYIVEEDTKGKYDNPFHVWFMHKSGFILRTANGVLGYKSFTRAVLEMERTIKLKGQCTLPLN